MPDYTVSVERAGSYEFLATASSGAQLRMATKGTEGAFSPVEALLAALGGCGAFGVERFLTRRAGEPVRLDIALTGDLESPQSSRLAGITVTYDVATEDGAVPGEPLRDAVRFTHTRSCTVSLALHDGVPVQISPEL
jgi:putative redox protein